jgi:hypothetical protein
MGIFMETQMDGQTDAGPDKWIDRQKAGQIYGWSDRLMDRQMDGQTDG